MNISGEKTDMLHLATFKKWILKFESIYRLLFKV